MTRPHVHHWALGDPVGPDVWGMCECRAVKSFPAYLPADVGHRAHRTDKPSRAQQDESIALMSHAQSLVTS